MSDREREEAAKLHRRLSKVRIVDDDASVPVDQDYQLETDPDDDEPPMISVNQRWPDGFGPQLFHRKDQGRAYRIRVMGLSHEPYRSNANRFIGGSMRRVRLVRNPQHPKDPNTIHILGQWTEKDGSTYWGQIGWVSHRTAAMIAQCLPKSPIAAIVADMYRPDEDGYGAIWLFVGRKIGSPVRRLPRR